MPRRKAESEAELLPPEDQPIRGRKKLVQARHKIEYDAPVAVAVEGDPEDADIDLVDSDIPEEKPKRRVNSEREELRKKLAKSNITPGSELKLTIEKYSHSEVVDGRGGMFADTEHCQKYVCSEAHITSEDYLDVARKFGPGLYRFTLRMKNQIVTAWDKRISGGMAGAVIQHSNPNDPNSPQVIVQMPEGSQQPMPIVDPFKEAERALNFMKKYNEAFGAFRPQTTENPSRSEEEILASAILNRPEVIDTLISSALKRTGVKNGDSDEPWWAGMLKDSITTGQLAPTVQGLVKALFPNGLFGGLFPGGQNNGQAQMAQTPLQTNGPADNQRATDGRTVVAQEISQGNQSLQSTSGEANQQSGVLQRAQMTPEDPYTQMLSFVITTLAANGSVEDAVKRVDGFLLFYPAYTETIDAQFGQAAETLLGAISTIPGCEQIAQAEHSKQWIEQFQAKFFAEGEEAGQEGEE